MPHHNSDTPQDDSPPRERQGEDARDTWLSYQIPEMLYQSQLTDLTLSIDDAAPRIPWFMVLEQVQRMLNLKQLSIHQVFHVTTLYPPPAHGRIHHIENPSLLTVDIKDEYEPTHLFIKNIRFPLNTMAPVTFKCTGPVFPADAEDIHLAFGAIHSAYNEAHRRQSPLALDMVEIKHDRLPYDVGSRSSYLYGLTTSLSVLDAIHNTQKELLHVFIPDLGGSTPSNHCAPFVRKWLDNLNSGQERLAPTFRFSTDLPLRQAFWRGTIRTSPILKHLILEGAAVRWFFGYLARWYRETGITGELPQPEAGPLPINVRTLELNITSQIPAAGDFLWLRGALMQKYQANPACRVRELYVTFTRFASQLFPFGDLVMLKEEADRCQEWVESYHVDGPAEPGV